MKQLILPALIILCIMPFAAKAQTIYDGDPMDSTMITFASGSVTGFSPDTATNPLWQVGRTHKSFFTTDSTAVFMMTDTLHAYPANANNWFTIMMPGGFNIIVDFWHKYQTDSSHAGGVVEFTVDNGLTWQNIKGACNADAPLFGTGTLTENFYSTTDTLLNGEPAFTGTSGSAQQYSRFQFFDGFPVRTTNSSSSGCNWSFTDTFYVRFRFESDSTTDTLAGWEIDSIKIEQDFYGGSVAKIHKQNVLNISPNPTYTGLFTFPTLTNEQQFSIEVYNAMGARILKMPYSHSIDLSSYAKGLYFYKVSDGTEYYSGRLLTE